MQKIMGLMRKAMEQYEMINEGDVVAVGLSGGKDSVALLFCLSTMRRYYPKTYDLKAILLDPCFHGPMEEASVNQMRDLCAHLEVEFIYEQTNIGHVVFSATETKYPCSLCAKLRRGTLCKVAAEHGCNKLALGHHRDDVVETFYMNLLDRGSLGCFAPVTHLSDTGMTVIRPMVMVPEQDIASALARNGLPILASTCPVDKATERQRIKFLLATLRQDYPAIPQNVISILQSNHINNW